MIFQWWKHFKLYSLQEEHFLASFILHHMADFKLPYSTTKAGLREWVCYVFTGTCGKRLASHILAKKKLPLWNHSLRLPRKPLSPESASEQVSSQNSILTAPPSSPHLPGLTTHICFFCLHRCCKGLVAAGCPVSKESQGVAFMHWLWQVGKCHHMGEIERLDMDHFSVWFLDLGIVICGSF